MKLAFAYVRVSGGGFLLVVWVFWLRLVVLAFVLLGRLLLGHSVIYGRKWHNRQTNTRKL
jgi:hypothetical protein